MYSLLTMFLSVCLFPQDARKNEAKRSASCTRGSAMSFGFRRGPPSGIPMPVSAQAEATSQHPRSKSAGPEKTRKVTMLHNEEDLHCDNNNAATSGRSTPRLPAKRDIVNGAARSNRFGFRQPQAAARLTNKVGDAYGNPATSNQDRLQPQVI